MKKVLEKSFSASKMLFCSFVLAIIMFSVSSCQKDDPDDLEGEKCEVTLVRNNGQADTIIEVTVGSKMRKPVDPVKTETGNLFTFNGWYLQSDFSGDPFDFDIIKITEDITLYAKFTGLAKVTFHTLKSDGSADSTFVVLVTPNDVLPPINVFLPRKIAENKFFAGWFDAPTGGNEFVMTTPITKDMDLYYSLVQTNYKVFDLDDTNLTLTIGGYIESSPTKITNVTTFAPPAKIGAYRVKQIGRDMFYPVDNGSSNNTLTTVVLPEGVEEIIGGSFRNCGALTSITIPSTVKTIEGATFWGCGSLKSIALPEGLSYISMNLFVGAGITSITIPSTVTEIRDAAFVGTKLTSINIPDNVKKIGANAFLGCNDLKSLNFNKETSSLDSICQGAFAECHNLETVKFPNSLKKITENNAFINCLKLKTITIPANVEYIGSGTFALCDELSTAIFEGTNPPYLGDGVFNKRSATEVSITKILIKVPKGSLDTYLNTLNGTSWQYWRDGIHGDIVENN